MDIRTDGRKILWTKFQRTKNRQYMDRYTYTHKSFSRGVEGTALRDKAQWRPSLSSDRYSSLVEVHKNVDGYTENVLTLNKSNGLQVLTVNRISTI